MAIKITENLLLQLPELISEYIFEWCEVILEIENEEFLIFPGQLEIKNNEVFLKGIKNTSLHLFYNMKYNLPFFRLIDKFQNIRENYFINIYFKFLFSETSFSNQWKPPLEVLYPGQHDLLIPIISEVEFMEKINFIFKKSNNNSPVEIYFSYFDDDINIIKDFIEEEIIDPPKIKKSRIIGTINNLEKCIYEENRKKYTFSYNAKLSLGKIIELNESTEMFITELNYII